MVDANEYNTVLICCLWSNNGRTLVHQQCPLEKKTDLTQNEMDQNIQWNYRIFPINFES